MIGCIKLISVYFHKMHVYTEIYIIHQRIQKYAFNLKFISKTIHFCLKDLQQMCANFVDLLYIHIQMHNCFLCIDTHTHFVAYILKFDKYIENKTQEVFVN